MRTTLTLDDDVAAKLKAEMRRTGMPFKELVNESLRTALTLKRELKSALPFVVQPRNLGRTRAGVSLDNIGALLDDIEGHEHR